MYQRTNDDRLPFFGKKETHKGNKVISHETTINIAIFDRTTPVWVNDSRHFCAIVSADRMKIRCLFYLRVQTGGYVIPPARNCVLGRSSVAGDITPQTCHVPGDVRRVERKLEERLFTCSVITLAAVHSRRTCIHSEMNDTHSNCHGRISTSS